MTIDHGKQPLILIIDDDVLPTNLYLDALRASAFRAEQCKSPEEALAFLQSHQDDGPAAIVLDIMMPAGTLYAKSDTKDGFLTGVYLFRDIRKLCDVPIIILTNLPRDDFESLLGSDPKMEIIEKLDCGQFELVETIRRWLE